MSFKDITSKDLTNTKEKLEKLLLKDKSLNDILENNIKNYVHNLMEMLSRKTNDEVLMVHKKMDEIKMENNKFSLDLINETNNSKQENQNILNTKNEIFKKLEFSLEVIIERNKLMNDKYESVKAEINVLGLKISNMKNSLKVTLFLT